MELIGRSLDNKKYTSLFSMILQKFKGIPTIFYEFKALAFMISGKLFVALDSSIMVDTLSQSSSNWAVDTLRVSIARYASDWVIELL